MNELTKIIFEKLNIEPIEIFEITSESKYFEHEKYLIDENLQVFGVTKNFNIGVSFPSIETFINDPSLIKKIPKPLLTEEEKEFLNYFGFDNLIKVKGQAIIFSIYTTPINRVRYSLGLNALKLKFNGLQFDKEYSKEELGLWRRQFGTRKRWLSAKRTKRKTKRFENSK